MEETISIEASAEVKVPRRPNFIEINGQYKPLGDLSDEALKKVGQIWTELLLRRARDQRTKL